MTLCNVPWWVKDIDFEQCWICNKSVPEDDVFVDVGKGRAPKPICEDCMRKEKETWES